MERPLSSRIRIPCLFFAAASLAAVRAQAATPPQLSRSEAANLCSEASKSAIKRGPRVESGTEANELTNLSHGATTGFDGPNVGQVPLTREEESAVAAISARVKKLGFAYHGHIEAGGTTLPDFRVSYQRKGSNSEKWVDVSLFPPVYFCPPVYPVAAPLAYPARVAITVPDPNNGARPKVLVYVPVVGFDEAKGWEMLESQLK